MCFVGTVNDGYYGDMAIDDITVMSAPTAAPTTLTPPPSATPAPSPIPTDAPYFEATTFEELQAAASVPRAVVNVTADLIEMPTQIVISDEVKIFSECNTTLQATGDTIFGSRDRHFYLVPGSRLQLEGLIMIAGNADDAMGGGSITVGSNAHLEASNCHFEVCSVKGTGELYGGTIAVYYSTASFQSCSFHSSADTTNDANWAYGTIVSGLWWHGCPHGINCDLPRLLVSRKHCDCLEQLLRCLWGHVGVT